MIRSALRRTLGWVAGQAGYDLVRRDIPPAHRERPVGNLRAFLEDLHARGFRPRHILDVGANQGDWSRTAHAVFPEARFTLLEPVRAFEKTLQEFAQSVPGSRYLAAGAGATPGELELDEVTTPDGRPTSGSSFRAAPHDGFHTRRVRVPIVTLDSLMDGPAASQIPELVKIDVEGFEPEVLKGSRRLLGTTEIFIIETSLFPFWQQPIFHELIAMMAGTGYVVYDFPTFNRRPIDGALGLADVCFVRGNSALRSKTAYE
jgi:FkbM family methyltransferase